MFPKAPSSDDSSRSGGVRRLVDDLLIAALIVTMAVAIGVSVSFELAAIFSTSAGVLMVLGGVAIRFLRPAAQETRVQEPPRLLRPRDESIF